jgi:hypothetical protein
VESSGDGKESIEARLSISRVNWHGSVHGLANDRRDWKATAARLGTKPTHLIVGEGDLRPYHTAMLSPQ